MKHAVITGGKGGLGTAVAGHLNGHGWTVDAPGSRELDVRDATAVKSFFRERAVDLLICSAGIVRDAPLAKLDEAAWDEVMAVNFTGARLCAEAALPGMISSGGGHIIFVSSFSALRPPVGQAAYATAKAALLGHTTELAARHGGSNIRVNAILPGFLETRMTRGVGEKRRAEILGDHRLGRFNTPEAVAAFIRCLHEELPHTSGQVFQLDSRSVDLR